MEKNNNSAFGGFPCICPVPNGVNNVGGCEKPENCLNNIPNKRNSKENKQSPKLILMCAD